MIKLGTEISCLPPSSCRASLVVFRTLGAFCEDDPLIATFPHRTGQSRARRPDKALGGLWESSVPIAMGVPPGAIGSWPVPDRLARPAGPWRGTIEAEEFSPGAWGTAVDKAVRPVPWPPQRGAAVQTSHHQVPTAQLPHASLP